MSVVPPGLNFSSNRSTKSTMNVKEKRQSLAMPPIGALNLRSWRNIAITLIEGFEPAAWLRHLRTAIDFRSEAGADNPSENFSQVDGHGSETLVPEHVGCTLLGVGLYRGVRCTRYNSR